MIDFVSWYGGPDEPIRKAFFGKLFRKPPFLVFIEEEGPLIIRMIIWKVLILHRHCRKLLVAK